ncbi:acyl-CoA thioesterase [Litoribacter populi]|uniref:acyl-CoA thioesterase n=1 Tax=Litoribacter populi TaxID=2598460 RepID=UPI0011811FE4|nr:thioesterase family protein [Litoribacter populi]
MKKYTMEDVKSSFSFSIPVQVKFSDIDGYMHVNNGIYFNYFEHARAIYLYKICEWDMMSTGAVVANVNLDFLSPIHLMDEVYCYVRAIKIGKSSFVLEQVLAGKTSKGDDKVFASGNVTMVTVDMKTIRPTEIPEQYVAKMKALDKVES